MRLIAACIVVCLLAAGCGRKAQETAIEKMIEKETGGKADVKLADKKFSMEAETEDGKVSMIAGEGTKIPENFPDDVVVPKGATVTAAMSLPNGHSVSFQSKESVDDVLGAYKTGMPKKGWSQQASVAMGGQSVLMFKKDNRVTNVSASSTEGTTWITLTVAKED
jgi:hypothetical protein